MIRLALSLILLAGACAPGTRNQNTAGMECEWDNAPGSNVRKKICYPKAKSAAPARQGGGEETGVVPDDQS
jgi:hypothetical protein